MKKILASMAAVLLAGSPAAAATLNFLQFGAGARAAGMGDAYTAVADDANAVYWNPAALTRVQGRSVTFMHALHIENSNYDFGAYGQSIGRSGGLGVSLQYFSYGALTQTDASGASQGTLNPNDSAVALGYGYRLDSGVPGWLSGWSAGVGGKAVRSQISEVRSAFAADVGLLSPAYFGQTLRLSAVQTNLGGRVETSTGAQALPSTTRLGVALLARDGLLLASDLAVSPDSSPGAAIGLEYAMVPLNGWRMALRVGGNTASDSLGGASGFTMGVGIDSHKIAVDYAMVPMGDFGTSHRLSVGLSF